MNHQDIFFLDMFLRVCLTKFESKNLKQIKANNKIHRIPEKHFKVWETEYNKNQGVIEQENLYSRDL